MSSLPAWPGPSAFRRQFLPRLDPADRVESDVVAALLAFPVPLIVADAAGEGVVVNAELLRRFGAVEVDASSLEPVLRARQPECRVRLLRTLGATVLEKRAHALRLQHEVVLLVGDAEDAPLDAEARRLKVLVGHLERLAATDRLTGVWNRAHFERSIGAEIARANQRRQPLSLVLFDVDHFKRIGEMHGEAAGDQVLQRVVQAITAHVRDADGVYRWSHQEFAVLMTGSGFGSAERVAARIVDAVAAMEVTGAGRVTLSAGVAERRANESGAEWLQRLDEALYAAKEGGRNRVVVDRRSTGDDGVGELLGPSLQLEWRDEFEYGEPLIDRQHRELFERSNELIDAAVRDRPTVLSQLDRLVSSVRAHFGDEEDVLSRRGYRELTGHKRAHATLLARGLRLRDRAAAGDARLGTLVDFLVGEVVSGHLLTADREFASLFRNAAGLEREVAPEMQRAVR